MTPGELLPQDGELEVNEGRETRVVRVRNTGDRPIQVGSHYHFAETNAALEFERDAARGCRLNIAAGTAVRFEPGQTRTVELVALVGARSVYGFRQLVMGPLDPRAKTRGGRGTVRSIGASLLALAIAAVVLAAPSLAEAKDAAAAADSSVVLAALATRAAIRQAVEAKDLDALHALYAERFTHTHDSGKIDGRDARIVSLLKGEPTIELAPMSDLEVTQFAGKTAILRARSPIRSPADGLYYDVRWVQVYVNDGQRWQLVSGQSTQLPGNGRPQP